MTSGRLTVLATPIGNLADLSPRAAEALRAADVVACEDTRRTATLLAHVGATARMLPAHQHNEAARTATVRDLVAGGDHVVLVSDAGAPGVSDPGARIVAGVLAAGLPVEAVPGPSALTAALAVSGLPADRVAFTGFVPRKAGERAEMWDAVDALGWTVVALEAPNRLPATLAELAARDPAREVVVCRELTKLHEEIARGPAEEIAARFAGPPRGEVTLVVAPAAARGDGDAERLETALSAMLAAGLSPRAAADLAARLGLARPNAAYRAALALASRADM